MGFAIVRFCQATRGPVLLAHFAMRRPSADLGFGVSLSGMSFTSNPIIFRRTSEKIYPPLISSYPNHFNDPTGR